MGRVAPGVVLCALLFVGCAGQADLSVAPRYQSHTETLSQLPAQFHITVGGETEPRMVALTLGGPIADATVTCDRWIDVTSLEGMLKSIITPEMTDQEKAFAIWHFVMDWCHEYDGHSCDDPLEYATVWGYSYCGPMAILTDALCDAAGVHCRYINPAGHGTTEMFWDGEWHLLDSSCRYYFLRRDNKTLASIHDLAQDNELVTRTHDDVGRAMKWGGDVKNDLTMWGKDSDDWVTESFSWWKSTKWDPRVTLWRGEVLARQWDSRGLWCRAHGEKPPYISANGTVHYEPDLRTAWAGDTWPGAEEVKNFTFDPAEGVLRPRRGGEAAALVFKLRTPYFMPQVQVMGKFLLEGTEARARISLSVDGGKSWNLLREASGPGLITLLSQSDLTQKVTHESPDKYTVLVRYELEPGGSPAGSALTALAVHGDLQYYPKALPALRRGENTVTVKGTLPAGGGAKVMYEWLEDLNITLRPRGGHPERPRVGLPSTVTGRVTNRGDGPADGVRVRFYEGDPTRNGKPIAQDVVIPRLGPGETKEVAVTWVPASRPSWYDDMTQVWMVVDPDNAIAEAHEDNNATYLDAIVSEKPNLVLLDPSFVTVDRQGDTVTLTAAVRNWDLWGLAPGNAVLQDVVVRFFDGDPKAGGKPIGTDQAIPKIVAGEYGWASVKWDVAGLAGAHKVHVLVDPDGKIPERFESPEHSYDEVVVDVGL
jgi:hypothetical protein